MRFASIILAALVAISPACLPAPARAAAGGPDNYGYVWRDGAEPGITYAWEDITTTGTEIPMVADDLNSRFLPISFAFPYRGLTYSQLAACTNGWISLVDAGADNYENLVMPTAGPPAGTFAAFWDDFKMDDGGKVYMQDFGDHVVVSWVDVPYFSDTSKLATFEIILFADGRIRSQIAATTGPLDSATIGIESVDDTDGLTAWFNVPIPPPPYVVEFTPPASIPATLDCAGAVRLSCGTDITTDLAAGTASQSTYRCTRDDLSGREQVYLVDFTTPTSARIVFEPMGGDPRMIILPTCDPNACSVPAGNLIALNGYVGSFTIVIDCPPGAEGRYRLRMECLPLPTSLDCSASAITACGAVVADDLLGGTAGQDSYWCSLADYSGLERVYVVDFPVQLPSATFTLTALSGNPDLIVLYPCDANACIAPPADAVTIADPVGTYFLVVDCAPGDEGAFELAITGGAAPSRNVGDALRATGKSLDTVTFDWSSSPAPFPGEEFAVLRSENDPQGAFEVQDSTRSRTWTDPAATATFPWHVWFYTVLLSDSCGNLSAD